MTRLTQITGGNVRGGFTRRYHTVVTGDTGLCCCRMVKGGNQPVRCGVADIAGVRSGNMISSFSGRDDSVMTAFTGTDDLRVIHQRIHRAPERRVMAGLAKIAAIDMTGPFTCRACTFMTVKTGLSCHRSVIKCRHRPCRGVMTGIAGFAGNNVIGALPRGNFTIMTARAGSHCLRVIDTA